MNSLEARFSVAVVVVNYRTPELVISCLEKMKHTLAKEYVELVIVDNHSEDESITMISAWAKQQTFSARITIIETSFNGGFSYGNNQGIEAVNANYYLLLNSDAYVVGNCVEILVSKLNDNKNIGIVSPKLTWPDGIAQQSTFNYHHPLSEIIAQARTGYITRLLNRYDVPLPLSESERKVEWTSFACVMLSRQLIDDIGLLDSGFFMYFEDVDYCYRANQAGWIVKHIPDAEAVHLRGGSSEVKKKTIEKQQLPKFYYQARSRLFYKCYGYLGLLIANLCWLVGRGVSLIRLVLGNRRMIGVKKQGRDIWSNFFNPKGPYTHPSSETHE